MKFKVAWKFTDDDMNIAGAQICRIYQQERTALAEQDAVAKGTTRAVVMGV